MTHTDWLNNEYSQWIKALEESTIDNFKSHPMVVRMLSEVHVSYDVEVPELCREIDKVGGSIKGQCERFVFYAKKVLAQNPTSICEIGGGCGQFYATLRALGYQGKYFIFDLPEVKKFQRRYFSEIEARFGLSLPVKYSEFDFCVSFYALGELDDENKNWYVENVVKQVPHGLVIWNPHSGATKEINFPCNIEPENPDTSGDGSNKLLTW